jgi:AcrR family transcriptional regulator
MVKQDENRGPYAKGILQRQQILNAALELFARQGYEASTLSAIATFAGITREALRHYFNSRDDVFLAIIGAQDTSHHGYGASSGGSLFDQIVKAASRNSATPGLSALNATLAARAVIDKDSPTSRCVNRRMSQLRAEIREEIRRSQELGVIRSDIAPGTLAAIILATSDGLTTQSALPDATDATAAMRALEMLMTVPPHSHSPTNQTHSVTRPVCQ